jgi:hypothetical protein
MKLNVSSNVVHRLRLILGYPRLQAWLEGTFGALGPGSQLFEPRLRLGVLDNPSRSFIPMDNISFIRINNIDLFQLIAFMA